ncbi:MAG: hypothetical protein R3B81_19700 [bacterium]
MKINSLGRCRALLVVLLAAFAAGCGKDAKTPVGPELPDISTPLRAITALKDAYGRRQLDDALYLLAPDFRYVPDPSADVPFLAPGETSWDLDRETAILERLLVPERITWLDQVLLEFDVATISDSTGTDDLVLVTGNADLLLLEGTDQLVQASSNLELVYREDADGNHFLVEVHETAIPTFEYAVSEAKSVVESPPILETGEATEVTATTATLNATVNAAGLPTTWWFEWGETTAYGNQTAVQSGGEADSFIPRAAGLTGLTADTEYHFRIVANSDWGTSTGDDAMFQTQP